MALLYFHDSTCLSPQQTFPVADLSKINFPANNILEVNEPGYEGIPPGILRRMGKAIRMGVGASLPLLKNNSVDGIIIGTANGGMEDCIKFLNQIIDYNEGRLTPGNFVGSTANAIAAQLGLFSSNKGYNNTHVQSGLSFENALLDAAMLLAEKPASKYLVGGVDEISAYNYNIDKLAGWYKHNNTLQFYEKGEGSIPGEGAAMFIVSAKKENAAGALEALEMFHTDHEEEVTRRIQNFVDANGGSENIGMVLAGENGDDRYQRFYQFLNSWNGGAAIARFKHFTGEYATASAVAVWLALQIYPSDVPHHMLVKQASNSKSNRVLLVNHYRANQHSLMLLNKS